MKDLNLLVWVTQFGLSVAVPPACFIFLALWLRDSCGWGGWVLWAGIVLGILTAASGLRTSLKVLSQLASQKKDDEPPAVSFNDHD